MYICIENTAHMRRTQQRAESRKRMCYLMQQACALARLAIISPFTHMQTLFFRTRTQRCLRLCMCVVYTYLLIGVVLLHIDVCVRVCLCGGVV